MIAARFAETHASTKGHRCQAAPGAVTGAPPDQRPVCLAPAGWWGAARASGDRDGGCLHSWGWALTEEGGAGLHSKEGPF